MREEKPHTQTVLATLRMRQATFRESIFSSSEDGSGGALQLKERRTDSAHSSHPT